MTFTKNLDKYSEFRSAFLHLEKETSTTHVHK